MRAAANKPNINIVAVNDPFIPVDYMEYVEYVDDSWRPAFKLLWWKMKINLFLFTFSK